MHETREREPPRETQPLQRAVRGKVIELAARHGVEGSAISDVESLSERGVLDSVGILELVMWVETEFDVEVRQTDLNAENYGTIEAIANYLRTH
ncbi:MAG: acyl carrier protein, partial [Vicinamibacterales bacterium]